MLEAQNDASLNFRPTEEMLERRWHLSSLLSLGNVLELDLSLGSGKSIVKQLEPFDSSWVTYNPHKPEMKRKGLSITSLDGGLSGEPDLNSLQDYAAQTGKLYRESDFKTLTKVYEFVPLIHPLIDLFKDDLGRTHFLKLDAGGFFPPHRDAAMMDVPDCFRILVPITNSGANASAFVLDGEVLNFKPVTVYVVNTLLVHSLFSFLNDTVYLICNVPITAKNIRTVKSKLVSK